MVGTSHKTRTYLDLKQILFPVASSTAVNLRRENSTGKTRRSRKLKTFLSKIGAGSGSVITLSLG